MFKIMISEQENKQHGNLLHIIDLWSVSNVVTFKPYALTQQWYRRKGQLR